MADVQDLFVERIDGDRYEFEDEWLAIEVLEEEIEVKGSAPERLEVRSTHHGPIVNDASAPMTPSRWRCAGLALDSPAVSEARSRSSSRRVGTSWRRCSAHDSPVSNLIWADRHGSIGYKTVGRMPVRRGGCPDLPKPGWTGEYEWEGTVPYDEMPSLRDPEAAT